jgi:16S rRNA (adenine1518-N6/adenine1519-N6)-dimethyltransferase
MTLTPLNIPALLRSHGLRPKKSLGQNFLVDDSALERIVAIAEVTSDSSVLEVGPGLGSLTRYLAQAAGRVVAVELDIKMISVLEDVLSDTPNVEVVHGDMLKIDPAKLMGQDSYLVVANIPYYITSNLIRHLLEAPLKPSRMVLTIQREVAERITAKPGDLSLLALSVQVYGQARVAARIPAGAFYPAPDVDSAALRIDLYPEPLIPTGQLDAFFRLAKAGYGQKRKTLRNSLSSGLSLNGDKTARLLETAGINPMRRAETLSIEEWKTLVQVLQANPSVS